ncbi:MAG: cell division ATP-binding protein FtsE [Candidatus Caldipriscus sp.]
MVDLKGVSKFYGDYEILRDVSLTVNKGDFVVIYGEVGAGKSTLLKLVYFQDFPDKGSVEVLSLNSDLARKRKGKVQEVRKKIGIITQEPIFINEMNCLENIILVLEALGFNRKIAENRAIEALERVGMLSYAKKFPYELSAGQRQKISIARAIAKDPVLLIADDPTLGLDDRSSYEIEQLILSLNEMGTTVIWGANRVPQNATKVSRIYRLKDGILEEVR